MNRIVDVIMIQMKHELNSQQCEDLETVLIKVLSNYDIVPHKNEIAKMDNFYLKYIKEFILYQKTNGRADSTIYQYVDTVKKMFNFLKKDLPDIRDVDIRLFLTVYEQCRKISKRSLDNMRRNIRSFFNFCVDVHYLNINPARTIKPIKSPEAIKKPYTKQELTKLEDNAPSKRDKAIIALFRSSGIRVSELTSLDITDIDFQNNAFFVWGKGKKEREVCFSNKAAGLIKDYLNNRNDTNTALFVHHNKPDRLKKNGVERMLNRLGKKTDIHAYPHRFRRTLITSALDQKMQPHLVASFAGHSDIKTTMIYCNANIKRMKRAYKKLKL